MAMSNKFVFAIFLLPLAYIVVTSGAESNRNFCPFPSRLKDSYDYNWQTRRNEWKNTKSQTDYFVFSLSWTPTFCASLPYSARDQEFQCLRSDAFGLVVHGLWPQTFRSSAIRDQPRNCRNEQQIPQSVIKRFYCLMPDEDLMQAEWEKHGSCYFNTATEYFTVIESLYNQLKIPDIRSMYQPTYATIRDAFLKYNPQLFSSAIRIQMDRKDRLSEIRICYDLQYNFINCL